MPFLIGHPFNLWQPTTDPGWRWLWWQYGLADTRYRSDDAFIFGLEFGAVLVLITGTTAGQAGAQASAGATAEPVLHQPNTPV